MFQRDGLIPAQGAKDIRESAESTMEKMTGAKPQLVGKPSATPACGGGIRSRVGTHPRHDIPIICCVISSYPYGLPGRRSVCNRNDWRSALFIVVFPLRINVCRNASAVHMEQ